MTFDAELVELDRTAAATAALEHARERGRRKVELEDRMNALGNKLYAKLQEMLAIPFVKRVIEKGPKGEIIHLHPVKFNAADTARYIMALREASAFAAGVPSRIIEQAGKDGGELPVAPLGVDGKPLLPRVQISIVHVDKAGNPVTPPPPGQAPMAPAASAPVKTSAAKPSTFFFERS